MSVAGFEELPLELFSGLVTDLAASDLPAGASPACSDVAFILGGVLTRPGLGAGAITGLAGAPAVNYLKTFTDLTLAKRMLFLDSLGVFRQEFPVGVQTVLNPLQNGTPNAFAQSNTAFGREYVALSDGKFGVDVPRQWDTTNYDRISQCGPGAACVSVVDRSAAITAISRTSNIITVVFADLGNGNGGITVGGLLTILGVAVDATFNGVWPVVSVARVPFVSTTVTAWANQVQWLISSISRTGGTVTAVLAVAPILAAADTIIVGGVDDGSFDGEFTVGTVVGNIVTWPQVGTAASQGGSVYAAVQTVPIVAITQGAGNAAIVQIQLQGAQIQPFVAGQVVTIAGSNVSGYNASWFVSSAPFQQVENGFTADMWFFRINQDSNGDAQGGIATPGQLDSSPAASGIAGPAGHISAGIHQLAVIFVTRQGYLTHPSPPINWVASGGFTALVSGVIAAPADQNVIARIVAFTTADGATFFYLTAADATAYNMVIPNNTAGNLIIDFDDTTLVSGTSVEHLFDLVELGECAGVIAYDSRLFAWGERNKLQNFLNLTFDGGGDLQGPTGWTTVTNTSGGVATVIASPIWDGALQIVGNGTDPVVGMITQSAYQDYLGVAIIAQNVPYSVRVRVGSPASLLPPSAGSQLVIELYSPGAATSYGIFAVTAAQVGALTPGSMAEFIGAITTGIAIIPADLQLRVYSNGTLAAGTALLVDNIEIFPTKQPYNTTQVRASYVEDPESFDDTTGFQDIAPENGQAVRAAFVLREKLYWVKERSLYATEADGQNEPNDWTVDEISNKVGTLSVQGVDSGEEWAIIASRQGAYIFWGPEPVKISQEIQAVWNSINWAYGHRLWVRIDDVNRRVLIGVPVNGATAVNRVLVFDYRGIDTAQEIADHWTVRYSSYTGKILAIGNAPKWSPWTMSINAAAFIERPDGTAHTFMGNGAFTGKIYDLLDPQQPGSLGVYNDDGAGIPWTYSTYYGPGHMDEQALKFGSHRKLYGYLTILAEGSGQMDCSAQPIGNITPVTLPSVQLVNVNAPANVTNAARVSCITTITCAGGHGLLATDTQAVLQTLADPSLDGTFPILQILNATQFTIYQVGLPDIAPGIGGTVTRLLRDFEMTTNILTERCSYTFANHANTPNSWFKLEKLVMTIKPDPWSPVRGNN
jgi:hypothetical protein